MGDVFADFSILIYLELENNGNNYFFLVRVLCDGSLIAITRRAKAITIKYVAMDARSSPLSKFATVIMYLLLERIKPFLGTKSY